MSLCYATDPDYGTICTNKCPEHSTCSFRKTPLLIHVSNVRCSLGEGGLQVHDLYPEARMNGVIDIADD